MWWVLILDEAMAWEDGRMVMGDGVVGLMGRGLGRRGWGVVMVR